MSMVLPPDDEDRVVALIILFWFGALLALLGFYFWLWSL